MHMSHAVMIIMFSHCPGRPDNAHFGSFVEAANEKIPPSVRSGGVAGISSSSSSIGGGGAKWGISSFQRISVHCQLKRMGCVSNAEGVAADVPRPPPEDVFLFEDLPAHGTSLSKADVMSLIKMDVGPFNIKLGVLVETKKGDEAVFTFDGLLAFFLTW
jgi:hypothetical protein